MITSRLTTLFLFRLDGKTLYMGKLHSHTVMEGFAQLSTQANGLTSEEASRRLAQHGPNSLPEAKPRYLMGVGTPEDLIDAIGRGIDIFDCVLPTRLARHHSVFSPEGRLNLMNAGFARDPRPIDEECDCYTCRTFSRAYLRHLISARELLAATLLSMHNLRSLIRLVEFMRSAILDGTFEGNASTWLSEWQGNAVRRRH